MMHDSHYTLIIYTIVTSKGVIRPKYYVALNYLCSSTSMGYTDALRFGKFITFITIKLFLDI